MFYRLFGKSTGSKPSSAVNSSTAASAAGGGAAASGSATPNNGGGSGTPAAEGHAHGGQSGEDGGAVSGGTRGGGDRRAFQGEERLLEHPHGPRRYPLDPDDDAELLVLLAQQYSITSVIITHYRVKENYVEYVIECVRGYDAWRVYRRYQQFKALDHDLRQLCVGRHGSNHGAYGVVPVLPGSHWMDVTNQSPELVEQRRRYLEIYLQQLLVPKNLFYVARTALFDFLHDGEVPTHLKITGIQPLLGLISTRTDPVDCDDSDEALQRGQQQQQQQQPLSPARGDGEAATRVSQHGASDANADGGETEASAASDAHQSSTPEADDVARGTKNSAQVLSSSSVQGRTATTTTDSRGAVASPSFAASSAAFPNGERESREDSVRVDHEAEVGGEDGGGRPPQKPHDALRGVKSAHTSSSGSAVPFVAASSLQMSFTDERLPPASANCTQCNNEFTSFLYPHRCFFCRVQFCTTCLQKVSLIEGAAGATTPGGAAAAALAATAAKELVRSPLQATNAAGGQPHPAPARGVLACRQCAENYSRRLDRCINAPGGGAYRGMQSTLGPPSYGSSSLASSSASSGVSPGLSPAACVGGERSSMMLQKRNTGPGSPQPRASPTGSFASRPGGASTVGFQDFQLLTVIGRGTFGKVLKVQQRSTGRVYAMKIMNKATVYKRCMTSYMKEEKSILTSMKPHPYIVRCYYAFQTDYYLVFIMDYLPGGELYDYLYPKLRLTPDAACIYAAELVLALEHLHRQDVVHRDLKPENVVLTADGHLCLTDFGLARRAFSRSRRRSFVGSPEYVAPETIQGQVQTAAVDWWSFGIMVYEMLTGNTPFHARNNNTVYDNVLHKELKLPLLKPEAAASPLSPSTSFTATASQAPEDGSGFKGFTSEAASLLSGLLARDPSMRLQDATAIKKHPYFRGVDWEALRRKNVKAPCIPGDLRDNDVRHFKREFVSEWASVPPLTSMTRASIEALTKCFDNFPVSRTPDSPLSSSSPASSAPSPASSSPESHKTSGSGGHAEQRALSSSLTLLPPSVLSSDGRTLREPVHIAQSPEAANACFHGMWRVVSVEVHALNDGRVIFPWGGSVMGLLVYSSDARFSLQLSPSTRRPMGPVQRVGQLSKEDLCDAYCSYVASFGRFQIFPSSTNDGCGVVRHCAEGNLCPNLALANTVFQYRMDSELVPRSEERKRKAATSETGSVTTGALPASTAATASGGAAAAEAPPKPMRVPSMCESESSVEGRTTQAEPNSLPKEGEKAATLTGSAEEGRPTSPPPVVPRKRRYVLRLSTRPQRAFDENFLAFTSLVFEKVE